MRRENRAFYRESASQISDAAEKDTEYKKLPKQAVNKPLRELFILDVHRTGQAVRDEALSNAAITFT